MKTRTLMTGTLLAGLMASAAAAQEVNLRLSHWVPPTHPIQTMGIEPWVQSLSEASDGRIAVTIFPAQQLGAAPDHYDMARDGIADISYTNPGYQAGRFPIYSLIEIPFLADNSIDGAQALHEWYAPIAETEMADVKFCLANPHDPGTFHSKAPIHVPADINGLNVRPAHATMSRFVSELGGGPVQVPAPEAREAIANGTADAITFPWNSVYIFGVDSETPYHLDMPFYVSAQLLLINLDTYNNMPDDLRAILDDHCTPEWSKRFSTGWAENEASGRQKMIDSGVHTLYAPTDEEIHEWRDAAAPLITQWMEEVGEGAQGYYDGYLAALKRHDSRY